MHSQLTTRSHPEDRGKRAHKLLEPLSQVVVDISGFRTDPLTRLAFNSFSGTPSNKRLGDRPRFFGGRVTFNPVIMGRTWVFGFSALEGKLGGTPT